MTSFFHPWIGCIIFRNPRDQMNENALSVARAFMQTFMNYVAATRSCIFIFSLVLVAEYVTSDPFNRSIELPVVKIPLDLEELIQ